MYSVVWITVGLLPLWHDLKIHIISYHILPWKTALVHPPFANTGIYTFEMAMSTAHSRGYLQFVPAVKYDTGKRPSVSMNRDSIVVVVHNSQGSVVSSQAGFW